MILIESIKKIYLKLFFLSPKLLSTIIFIPFLYILGWVLAKPLLLLGLDKEILSLVGTVFTFFIFVFSLPKWFHLRWGFNNAWTLLGINNSERNGKFILYFIRGFLLSTILISLILFPIITAQWGTWIGRLSIEIILNAIFLIIGIGFAEELIFRGWLLEEFKKQFGFKKAIILQASLFSIVHIGFDLPFWQMIGILSGLFLLGIFLAFMRLENNNSLWGCIGLHGGLVGGWFLVNNGLFKISKDVPIWLVGPGNINTNPLGGFWGISLLFFLCFLYFFILKKNQKFN